MNIKIYAYYSSTLDKFCEDESAKNYGNYLHYPVNKLCRLLTKKGYNIITDDRNIDDIDIDIAIFFDLDDSLYKVASSLSKRIKKILVCVESPLYCKFPHHLNIMFDEVWDTILTYNRSFKSNNIVYYDIPITGNIENNVFVKSNMLTKGVVVSSFKNDFTGYVSARRDELFKLLANEDEIELFGKGWKKQKNIFGSTEDKIKSMIGHSFALVIENSIYDGYVTEKLGDAILAGLPSIYYGNSNHAKRRFPGTFVVLEEITYESFLCAKKELFDNYQNILLNVEKSFNNSEVWTDSFITTISEAISIKKSIEIKTKPLVSIITVVYNGAKFLEETIKSVINQTYENIEYIIIDGGSTDGTVDIIKKYEDKLSYWVSEKDKGISDAFNKGIRVSKGDYINFQGDGDGFISSHSIGSIFEDVRDDENIFISTRIQRIDLDGKKLFTSKYIRSFNKKSLLFKMSLPHQGLFTHKSYFQQYGLFDVNNTFCMDYEHLLRSYKKFPTVATKNIVVAKWRDDGLGNGRTLDIFTEYDKIKRDNNIATPFILDYIKYWSLFKFYMKKVLKVER